MALYEKKVKRSRWHSPISVILIFVLMIVLLQAAYGMYRKDREAVYARNLSEEKNKELAKKEKELSGELANLNTDEGIDQAVRDRFDVAKEGEGVVVIVDDSNQTAVANASGVDTSKFWQFFINLFSKK